MDPSRKEPGRELCIHRLLKARAGRSPEAVAVQAPGRAPLTYGRLFLRIDHVIQTLRSMGVGRHDRVAIAHPNGPEMAVAFLAVSAAAASAPLNPAYSAQEFEFYLTDLKARALVVQAGVETQAVAVAKALEIPVIELSPLSDAEAGLFNLSYDGRARPSTDDVAQPEDVALLLHTSGTTSRPKLVPLTQSNICSSAYHIGLSLELSDRDSCLNVMPLFHIHGLVGAVLSSLASGASVICAPGFYAPQFFAWLQEFNPTWYTAVPTMHQAILSRAQSHRGIIERCPLRFIRSSSAALPPQVMFELESVFNAPVIEAYGMTEAAHQMASNPLPPLVRKPGSVGRAAGPDIAIMDEAGSLIPAGEIGEIVIRGANVTSGYENNQEANQHAFTNGWFRTGDQGFLDREGYLYISGRLKEVINRGGEKISPREVDEALMEHPAIKQALAFAVPHRRLGEEVAAAVVLRENACVSERELREYVAARLAYFKVPQRILFLEEIPKGPTGKLQRIGLAERLGLATLEGDDREAVEAKGGSSPSTQLEGELAEIWAEALGLERVEAHDNFFSLGGDSMLAARIISGVDEAMQVRLSFLAFSEAPTVAEMARHIEEAKRSEHLTPALIEQDGQSSAIQRETLFSSEEGRRADFLENDIQEEVHVFQLSFAQQRLWFLDQLEPGSTVYNIPGALRLTGPLQVAALEQSLREIINRHEVLRTTFAAVNGEPVQVVTRSIDWTMPLVDLRRHPAAQRDGVARQLAIEEARAAFDLRRGPLLRAQLLRLDEAEHVLLLTMHHIVSDLWSRSVLFRELAVCYKSLSEGQTVSLPALPIQYADFATWQREWLRGEALGTQLVYWKQQLDGSPGVLELPTTRPRPPAQTFNGAHQAIVLPQSLNEALKALARREGVTLFMVLLAAYATLLRRYTGQEDINIGSPIAGRTRTETEELIGFFINTLVLRIDLSGNPTFRSLLARVREMALGAYSHQELPFEKLVEELQPVRDASRTPLFQTMFIMQNAPRPVFELAGLTLSPLEVETYTSKFELTLEVIDKPEGLLCRFEYNTDLFDAGTIERMMGHFQTLLEAVVDDPDQRLVALPLLTEGERHRLLLEWNETKADYPSDQCLHQLFEAQAQRTPDRIAVVSGGLRLTYAELDRRANQLARHLLALGLKREEIVGVCLERSAEMYVGLLGILKAGGAYLPLDPAYPKERLAFMLEDAQPSVLLIQDRAKKALPRHEGRVVCLDSEWPLISRESVEKLATEVTSESLAYIIYTSGSTGIPNGVQATHRGAVNRFQWMWQTYPFEDGEICCQKTSLNFVDSVWEIFGPLLRGVSSVIIADENLKDTRQLTRTLAAQHVTRIVLVPSLLRALLETSRDLRSLLPELKCWITSGEALTPDLANRFFEVMPQSRLINLYGSSEVSADVTCYEAHGDQADSSVPIGRPIANTQVYVLDPHHQPVPIGVPGELYIGGAGLARGYHQRPELTAQKFIPNPFSTEPGARLYRTGDAARYLPDGNLEYRGRLDRQVKVRGSRVEPGEVEAALAGHPKVAEVAVLPGDDPTGGQHLAAYIVAAQDAELSSEGLRIFLKDRLPEYMMPSTFFMLDALPLTPNGKVNRLALLSSARIELQAEQPFIAPRTPTEELLAGIWGEVLNCEGVGIHDDFFTLKGHSLLATRVISRVYDAFQVELPVRSIFDTPTIAGLAETIEKARRMSAPAQATTTTIAPSPRERHSIRLSKGEAVSINEAIRSGMSWTLQPSTPDGAASHEGETQRRPQQMRPGIEETFIAPRDAVELNLVRLWEEVLGVRPVGVRDDFFELGGHSLLATRLFSRIEKMYGYDLPVATLFQAPTVERLADVLRQEEHTLLSSPLVAIQPEGAKPPFFCVHAIGGGVLSYRSLALHLGRDQPFYGLQAHGLGDEQLRDITVEEMAARYIVSVRNLQPAGPFLLGGHSFGGVVAFEMARQLRKAGHEVALLALFEPAYPGYPSLVERIRLHKNILNGLASTEKLAYVRTRAKAIEIRIKTKLQRNITKPRKYSAQPAPGASLNGATIRALINYKPEVYSGRVDLFRAQMQPSESHHTQSVWERLTDGNLKVHLVPGDHVSIIDGPDVSTLAEQLKARLEEAVRAFVGDG